MATTTLIQIEQDDPKVIAAAQQRHAELELKMDEHGTELMHSAVMWELGYLFALRTCEVLSITVYDELAAKVESSVEVRPRVTV
ncbi:MULTISPECIES: hypothetical protein [Pseudomonas]|uniref:Uncharacterized protein n=2 Tax=Pseudomonas fragariae (ex Marin et al. 2024) TaxID=3080056 RepID=A0ABT3LPK5_9PSED|nr:MULTISPECIES: hypothetical protein [Pseudomonas]MCW6058380.1 hypothetical protein [Pseudomonas fragi]MDV0428479.1 hypothetical protein [Pseudomonas sp. 17]MDX9574306.1 hypothetical protein [Pseudomonas sp. 21(2023)]MDX9586910.1 hypothetical protein [Pseudomonas sp. 19(2023)]MDX9625708.1 hypothetical protein [Pseudomonas sp. 20]